MVHIYCGDGKGKTTASVGLALRMAGAGGGVLFAQFFKDGSSSEIQMLEKTEGIAVRHCRSVPGFYSRMTESQKVTVARDYTAFLRELLAEAGNYDLVVLDEVISAYNHGVVVREDLQSFLTRQGDKQEIVLTGRNPAPELMESADYITEMVKQKHPFDRGITARKGIEF